MDLKTFNPNGVGVDNGAYYGLPFTPEEAALVLVSAPWDVTVSYGAGTALAPDALIEASTQLDLYDASAPGLARRHRYGRHRLFAAGGVPQAAGRCRTGDRTSRRGGAPDDERIERRLRRINEGCAAMNDNIYRQARQWLSQGKVVGLVGGDHSTPYGLIRAVAEKEGSLGILHIDAHCDLREAYEGFEFSHASIMFNVLRDLPQVSKLVQVACGIIAMPRPKGPLRTGGSLCSIRARSLAPDSRERPGPKAAAASWTSCPRWFISVSTSTDSPSNFVLIRALPFRAASLLNRWFT